MSTPNANSSWGPLNEEGDDFLHEDNPFARPPANAGGINLETDLNLDESDIDQDAFHFENPAPPPLPDDTEAGQPAQAALAPVDARVADQPVPRISIHACCDRDEVADLIAAVAADRRLARAETNVEMGGMEAAITRFAAQSSPNLLLLDSALPGPALLNALDQLAQLVEPGTKVVILGAVNDIALFRELMARGVSEYIVPPFKANAIISMICGLYVNPEKPFAGRVISFIGARGGVGSSTIAHNLAWSIAERQDAGATLLDLDLSFGTAALDFNTDSPQSIADALLSPDRVDDVFLERVTTKQTQNLQILVAPATLEHEFELEPSAFELVIERVRKTSPFIVLDLPHVWSSWIKQTLLASDDVVIVAAPDLASLRNTKNIFDLMRQLRPYDQPPMVVLNTVGMPKRPEIPMKDFAEALGAEPLGSFAFDPALFGMAANNGQMLGEVAPKHKTAIDIDTLAFALTGRRQPDAKKPALFAKLSALIR